MAQINALQRLRGIYFELNTDKHTRWKLIPQPAPPRRPLADRFRAWARHNLSRGLPEQDEALELLWAMSLGWRTALTGEVAAPFMRSGTMHFFAISGLHIGLVAGIFVVLLRVVRVPRGWVGVVAIPLLRSTWSESPRTFPIFQRVAEPFLPCSKVRNSPSMSSEPACT